MIRKKKRKIFALMILSTSMIAPITMVTSCKSHKKEIKVIKDIKKYVDKPTKNSFGTIIGANGSATYNPKPIDGCILTIGYPKNIHNGILENGNILNIKYTLKKNYKWKDNDRSNFFTIKYEVSGLSNTVIKPNINDNIGTFGYSPVSGMGTFDVYPLLGTQIILKYPDHVINGALENGDLIFVNYKLKKGYVWDDHSNNILILKYIVKGLRIPVQKPNKIKNPITYPENQINGHRTFIIPTLEGTQVSMEYGRPIPKNLSNGSTFTLTYFLKDHYRWFDGSIGYIDVLYTVPNNTFN